MNGQQVCSAAQDDHAICHGNVMERSPPTHFPKENQPMPHHRSSVQKAQRFTLNPHRAAGAAYLAPPVAGTWVKLHNWEGCLGSDLALLLCEETDGWWSAWIPDWGPTALHTSQFFLPLASE
jgi:hypothetical protein